MRPLSALIPERVLIAAESFGAGLEAPLVARALARGLTAAGAPEPDLCPLILQGAGTGELRALLEEVAFDRRMREARAVLVAAERLQERAMAGSPLFEIATRARQAGVPAYAVAASNALDPFDARMLDLQTILEASTERALVAAGGKLAGLV